MQRRKTLLSAGPILMLIGVAPPAAVTAEASAGLQARSRTIAQADITATDVQADPKDPLRQRITLELLDEPLARALEAIARHAGFTLAYSADILPADKTVTLHASDLPVHETLRRVLDGTGLEPTIMQNGHVTVARKVDPPLRRPPAVADQPQQAEVTGTVTDAETGEPLRGADIRVDESALTTVTDAEGRYTLENVPPGTHTLVASMIGYGEERETLTVTAGATVSLDFSLTVSAVPLDEVVVTGTMVPTELRAVPSPVSVITADDIALMGAARFDDILRSIPGLGVVSRPGNPRLSYLFVRGTTGLTQGQTIKTYIDGVEVAEPIWSLNQIDPSTIERIELIRGPQASTLYGSEAIAGVLQIFTKKGYLGSQTLRVQATLLGGHLESQYEQGFTPVQSHNIAVTGGDANVSFNVGASYNYTGEWVEDELLDELGWSPANSVREDLGLSAGLRYVLGRVTAEASVRVHNNSAGVPTSKLVAERARDGRWNYAGATRPEGLETGLEAQTYGLTIDYEAAPWWTHHLAIGHDRTFVDYRQPQPRRTTPADTFLYYQSLDWVRRSVAYRTALTARPITSLSATLQTGIDRSSFHQRNVITEDARQLTGGLGNQTADVALGELVNHGFFGQARISWQDRIFLTTGIRADQNSGFGDDHGYAWSRRFGVAYVIDMGDITLKPRVSYGSAIRPPEPNQKLGRTDPDVIVLANEQLAPEAQSGYDLGAELYLGRQLSFSVTRYDQRADDLIAIVNQNDLFSAVPRVAQYQNVGRIKNTGWELEATANLASLIFRANYSVLESTVEKLSPTYTGSEYVVGQRPLWVPTSTANASITHTTSRATVSIAMTHKGSWQEYRYIPYLEALLGNDPDRDPYTGNARDYIHAYASVRRYTINASYRLAKHGTALLTIDNLLNANSPTQRDIDLVEGRQIMLGMRVDFGS